MSQPLFCPLQLHRRLSSVHGDQRWINSDDKVREYILGITHYIESDEWRNRVKIDEESGHSRNVEPRDHCTALIFFNSFVNKYKRGLFGTKTDRESWVYIDALHDIFRDTIKPPASARILF